MGRGALPDGRWARLEPLLPRGITPGRPRVWTRRRLTEGIRWRTRTGVPLARRARAAGAAGPGLRPCSAGGGARAPVSRSWNNCGPRPMRGA
ncbi:transposase [Streptomyces sp. NPDC093094]|uniref:transposase n=1 Tax=Streptomyces sp. NPDC093094 TaxID=3366026 RepID=UPI00381F604B